MWAVIGLILAVLGAALGASRARKNEGGYYDAQVYHMTAVSHRRFSIASIAFAALFALVGALPLVPAWPLVAAYVVFFVLYASSFARGATGEDE
ncbi:MAG: hypothetical protein JO359_01020 [Candidatus Eremiobacteraeota bacterium]|nr:hypothetical protein [Candidatus Eremiobacteraeota bacterium]